MGIGQIDRLDPRQVNTRYFEFRTLLHGTFRFRTIGSISGGVGMIEVEETGQAFPSGVPEGAQTVPVEFYMADADVVTRWKAWCAQSRARAAGYLDAATVAYLRDAGDPDDVVEMAIPECWALNYQGPEASKADAALGKITGNLVVVDGQMPNVTE